MSNRAWWILPILGIAAIIACTIYVPIFPVPPAPELRQIHDGMTLEQVEAVFGRPPSNREDGADHTWLFWFVQDGVVTVRLNEHDRVDMAFFHASRSSVWEDFAEMLGLARRFLF